jgi:chemotaxis response regulator CheB
MPERTVLAPDHGGIPGAARQGKVVVCKGANLAIDGRSANDRFRAVSGSQLARSRPSVQRRKRPFGG